MDEQKVYQEAKNNLSEIQSLSRKIEIYKAGHDSLQKECLSLGVPVIKLPKAIESEIAEMEEKVKTLEAKQKLFREEKGCWVFPEPNNNLKGSFFDRQHGRDMIESISIVSTIFDFRDSLEAAIGRGDKEKIYHLVLDAETAPVSHKLKCMLENVFLDLGIDKEAITAAI